MSNPKTIEKVLVKVAKRVPPGDRWSLTSKPVDTYDSLTEMLQYLYELYKTTEFHVDAGKGLICIYRTEEVEVKAESPKEFSLYGDDN